MMSNELVRQIEALERRLQRRRVLTATCWAVVAVTVVTLALVGVDRLLGIDDLVGRTLATVALITAWVVIGQRWWAAAWDRPVTALEVAAQVEHQHPQLRDLVTSALDFTQQSDIDPTAGSSSLRRAVVLRATSGVNDVNWNRLVPRRPLRRAAVVTTAVVSLVSLLAWWTPSALGIGVLRLLNPLSRAEWPRTNDLHFVDAPRILAAGDDLILKLRDHHGALPTSLAMHYRLWRNDHWQEEMAPLAAIGAETTIRRPSVQSSLQYRATGGDHRSMPWQKLRVVPSPHVDSLQLTVKPPTYTRLSPRSIDDHARVIVGSDLQLRGETDQPLTGIALCGESGWRLPLRLGKDRSTFSTGADAWRADQSEVISFELTTPSGLTTRAARRIVLEVVSDLPPQVRFVEPIGEVTLVPTAQLDLTIAAYDDLALRDVELVFQRTDRSDAGDQVLPLWRGPPMADGSSMEQTVVHRWQLADLGLAPGSVVEAHGRASDYQPAIGQTSHPLRIAVVSPGEMVRQIIEREARLLRTIDLLLQHQRELRAVTAAWTENGDRLAGGWVNEGHASLYAERRLAATLTDGRDSVVHHVSRLLTDLARNRLERPAMDERLERVRGLIQQLAEQPLPAIDQLLSELIRREPRNFAIADRLALVRQIADRQDEVVAGLEQMAELLGEGNLVGRFERELLELGDQQRDLAQRCQHDIAAGRLQPTDGAAEKQRQLARRLAELLLRMSQSVAGLAENPTLATRVEAAVAMSRELETPATMQAAAEHLSARRLGRCLALQQQAVEDLQELRQQLRGRDLLAANERKKRLRDAERRRQQVALARREMARLDGQLAALVARQQSIVDKIERLSAAGQLSDADRQGLQQVTVQQLALREEVVDHASRVKSLPVFAHLLRTAAGGMQQVATRLEGRLLDSATQQAARQVLEQLGWLVQAVQEERKKLAENENQAGERGGGPNAGDTDQLQSLQLAIGQIRLLRQLQSALHERTRRLEAEFHGDPPPGESLAERARALATEQEQLTRLAEQLQPNPPPSLDVPQ